MNENVDEIAEQAGKEAELARASFRLSHPKLRPPTEAKTGSEVGVEPYEPSAQTHDAPLGDIVANLVLIAYVFVKSGERLSNRFKGKRKKDE